MMERRVLILLILLPVVLVVSCQRQNQAATSAQPISATKTFNGPPGFPPPVLNKPYPGTGVLVLINRKEGWIEINHDKIKDLMPAMQMEFWVKTKSLLDSVKVGDRVDLLLSKLIKGSI